MKPNEKVLEFVRHCLYMESIQYEFQTVVEVERKMEELGLFQDIVIREIWDGEYGSRLENIVVESGEIGRQILEKRRKSL